MAFSREIIKKILQNVRFRVPKNERDSYYTTINNTLVHVSNHCTRLYVWDNFLEENPKCKGMPIVSIVFEDEEDTFIEEECLVLKRNRKKPVKVKEYVYRLQGNPHFIEKNDEKLIIQSIKNISGQYIDKTGKSESFLRVSRNPGTNENKQYNKNTNMNKKLIRLTESDLHKIVKEAVNKILTESSIDDVFDGMPHTYTVDLYTKSEGKFGYAFSNIRNYDELNAAIKERFPDVLNWKNPRRNKPFNGWH